MNRNLNFLLLSITLLIIFGFIGCGGSQDGAIGNEISSSAGGGSTETGNPAISGLIQKGPFYTGANVIIKELDDVDLMPTGIEHLVEVSNDLGEFEFVNTTDITSSYVEISATGYYYNEISGIESALPLTLSAFVDITTTQMININILTTIAVKREKYLITQGGKTYQEAKIQAQQEVLTVFKFSEDAIDGPLVEDIDTFIHMNIGQDGKKNAVLLSLSILLQNFQENNIWTSVSQAINIVSKDIEMDGVCDHSKYIDTIFKNSEKIDLARIRVKLESYYRALSKWFIIPDFETIFENHIIPYTRMTAPIFSRPSGTYERDISVELYSSTMGATIYYSINGSAPIVYENPIEISGNRTVVNIKAWSDISYMAESYEVSSYYIVDYDYDPSKYKTDMTIDDYRANIVGTWIGYIERPQQWLSPDSVKITFDATGQYSAEKLSFYIDSDIPIIDINQTPAYEQRGSDVYYGTNSDLDNKIVDINEIMSNGKAASDLISFGDGGAKIVGKLDEIAMSDDFNHLQYKFWCDELHGEPITFNLTRLIE